MGKKVTFLLVAVLCLIFVAPMMMADEAKKEAKKEDVVKHDNVGAKKCKICHKKDGTYPSWEETAHAEAFTRLSAEQQKNEACLACHASGVTAKGDVLEGVQCEACHGGGADYKKKSIMEDRKLAIEAGLIIPTEETCLNCHKAELPKECGETKPFKFEEMKAKGVHDMYTSKEEAK